MVRTRDVNPGDYLPSYLRKVEARWDPSSRRGSGEMFDGAKSTLHPAAGLG